MSLPWGARTKGNRGFKVIFILPDCWKYTKTGEVDKLLLGRRREVTTMTRLLKAPNVTWPTVYHEEEEMTLKGST